MSRAACKLCGRFKPIYIRKDDWDDEEYPWLAIVDHGTWDEDECFRTWGDALWWAWGRLH